MDDFSTVTCRHGNRLVDNVGVPVRTACGCVFESWGPWQPSLPMKWIGDDGHDYGDDPLFREWLLDPAQTAVIERAFRTSKLNAKDCKRLWHDLVRRDRVPKSLTVYVLEKALPKG